MAENKDFTKLNSGQSQIQLAMLPFLTTEYELTMHQGDTPDPKKAKLLAGNSLKALIHPEIKSHLAPTNSPLIQNMLSKGETKSGEFNAAEAEKNILQGMSVTQLESFIAYADRLKAGAEKALARTRDNISSK